MRIVQHKRLSPNEIPIDKIKIDLNSRDDIPKILLGIQHLWSNKETREKLFSALERLIKPEVSKTNGRPGMELWRIFVLGVLRLVLNWDYDRLQIMANNLPLLRAMLCHEDSDNYLYKLQTLRDNVSLFTEKILDEINQIVVHAGHEEIKKKRKNLQSRCDSFVVKTNVHFPTDITLLFDAMRKSIELTAKLCNKHNLSDFRQYKYNINQIKKSCRNVGHAKRSTSKFREIKIKKYHADYLIQCQKYLVNIENTLQKIPPLFNSSLDYGLIAGIDLFVKHAKRQIDQINRRVLKEEKIPHKEKIFSLFEPHTEWICKGKAGVPVELGLKVCIVEDRNQFILHHRVMEKETDDKITQLMLKETKARFSLLSSISYDRGFYTKENRAALNELNCEFALPKKGKLSDSDKEIEQSLAFIEAKKKHSAVESAINALDHHGLNKCLDHGIKGFKRYVALAIVARNIQLLGTILQKKKKRLLYLRENRKKNIA